MYFASRHEVHIGLSTKLFAPLEKCVGHSLKNLVHPQKTLRPPVSQAGYGPESIIQTHTFCTTQVDKTTALEAESQGCRRFLNRTFCNGVVGRTTGLQTHS